MISFENTNGYYRYYVTYGEGNRYNIIIIAGRYELEIINFEEDSSNQIDTSNEVSAIAVIDYLINERDNIINNLNKSIIKLYDTHVIQYDVDLILEINKNIKLLKDLLTKYSKWQDVRKFEEELKNRK